MKLYVISPPKTPSTEPDMELHKKLKSLREEHRISQEKIALGLGISQNAYSRIELGITKISIERLKKLAQILQVSIYDILDQGDNEFHGIQPGLPEKKDQIELYERIIQEKDEVIAILREQNLSMRQLIEKLTHSHVSNPCKNVEFP